ncbi:hypothetical protein [Egbenema bharatensis]|uniref:hypothetical protein n=1 Tax=Egbenema bharatensis TaxID=3463334 RepID=UPI003A898693
MAIERSIGFNGIVKAVHRSRIRGITLSKHLFISSGNCPMSLQLQQNLKSYESEFSKAETNPKAQIRKEIGRRIYELLKTARDLPPQDCLNEVRNTLSEIQKTCLSIDKSFIFVEKRITCANYQLGGSSEDPAILFRGPREDASVAICVTDKGSLLHRNGSPWIVYRDAGDVLKGNYQGEEEKEGLGQN